MPLSPVKSGRKEETAPIPSSHSTSTATSSSAETTATTSTSSSTQGHPQTPALIQQLSQLTSFNPFSKVASGGTNAASPDSQTGGSPRDHMRINPLSSLRKSVVGLPHANNSEEKVSSKGSDGSSGNGTALDSTVDNKNSNKHSSRSPPIQSKSASSAPSDSLSSVEDDEVARATAMALAARSRPGEAKRVTSSDEQQRKMLTKYKVEAEKKEAEKNQAIKLAWINQQKEELIKNNKIVEDKLKNLGEKVWQGTERLNFLKPQNPETVSSVEMDEGMAIEADVGTGDLQKDSTESPPPPQTDDVSKDVADTTAGNAGNSSDTVGPKSPPPVTSDTSPVTKPTAAFAATVNDGISNTVINARSLPGDSTDGSGKSDENKASDTAKPAPADRKTLSPAPAPKRMLRASSTISPPPGSGVGQFIKNSFRATTTPATQPTVAGTTTAPPPTAGLPFLAALNKGGTASTAAATTTMPIATKTPTPEKKAAIPVAASTDTPSAENKADAPIVTSSDTTSAEKKTAVPAATSSNTTSAEKKTAVPAATSSDTTFVSPQKEVKERVIVAKQPPPTLSGIVWKRRNGLGSLSASHAWERRRLLLKGTELFYFMDTASDTADGKEQNPPASTTDDADSKDGLKGSKPTKSQGGNWLLDQAAKFQDAKMNFGIIAAGQQVGQHVGHQLDSALAFGTTASSDPNEPRGCIDIVKEDAGFYVVTGHYGAPSPFALTIWVKNKVDNKWMLCFDTHNELMQWLTALSNVMVRQSIEEHVKENTVPGGIRVLWTESDSDKTDDDTSKEVEESAAKEKEEERALPPREIALPDTNKDEASTLPEWRLRMRKFIIETKIDMAVLYTNLCLLLAHSSGNARFWFFLILMNIGIGLCLEKEELQLFPFTPPPPKKKKKKHSLLQQKNTGIASPAKKVVIDTAGKESAVTSSEISRELQPTPRKEGFIPVAGSSTIKLVNENDKNTNKNGVAFPAWKTVEGSSMSVRSLGYDKSKKKVPSVGTLYDCVALDIFVSDARVEDIAGKVKLPNVSFGTTPKELGEANSIKKPWHSPNVLIISVAVPTEAPRLGWPTDDGEGLTIFGYFTMRNDTRRILEKIMDPAHDGVSSIDKDDLSEEERQKVNAVRLWEEWCRRSPNDPKFQGRFKFIPHGVNTAEIGLPSYISKYNGKPVLIRRSGVTGILYNNHPGSMEMAINLHAFPYIAKQAFAYMNENMFKSVICNMGFVIEGRGDDELPEVVVAAFQLHYPDPKLAVDADEFFQGTCPTSC